MKSLFAIGKTARLRGFDFGRRSAALQLLTAAFMLFSAFANAQTTNGLSEAEIKGRELARQLCEAKPETNFTQSGILNIRYSNKSTTNIPVSFKIYIWEHDPAKWTAAYFVGTNGQSLMVVHETGSSNRYQIFSKKRELISETVPFANSDFCLCDLGLEFFHWPQQKVLPKTTALKKGREYTLLESTNPNPPTNGYSRVLSWIDKESGGILLAEAYDAQGKLLKEFEPKAYGKDANGQWQLEEMQIRNVQTGSRTKLVFDLKNGE
jgi:hypothetical protein